jgi:hypothetical protein
MRGYPYYALFECEVGKLATNWQHVCPFGLRVDRTRGRDEGGEGRSGSSALPGENRTTACSTVAVEAVFAGNFSYGDRVCEAFKAGGVMCTRELRMI